MRQWNRLQETTEVVGDVKTSMKKMSLMDFAQRTICIPRSGTYHLSFGHKSYAIFLHMAGGGGGGGLGLSGSQFYGGAGGGAGATMSKRPITIVSGATGILFRVILGKGGEGGEDGGETLVGITWVGGGGGGGTEEQIFRCAGGKAGGSGSQNVGGQGGISTYLKTVFSGENGEDWQVTLPSQGSAAGGKGGDNFFSGGGLGGLSAGNENIRGLDGTAGSGGGGSSIGATQAGKGGRGFVNLEW